MPNSKQFVAKDLHLISKGHDEWINRIPVTNEPVMLASGGLIMFVIEYNDNDKSITVECGTDKHTFPRQCLHSMLIDYTLTEY